MGKVAPDPLATADESTVVAGGRYWYHPHKHCLEIPLCGGGCFRPLRIEEDTVANDQRLLARVSGEEARTYIRGVNARIAKSTRCYRWAARGCIACVFLGAALFGVMMELFYEKSRIRCTGRVCDVDRGEDPLVDGCCIFWCCGEEMKGKKDAELEEKDWRELRARPYDTSWDVWSNKTYFGDSERCSLYGEDHTKRDAGYRCDYGCPGGHGEIEEEDRVGCKTMYEGEAKHHEISWPLLLLIPFLVPIFFFIGFWKAYRVVVPRLYKEAFEPWVERGVVFHVNSYPPPSTVRLWLVRTDEIYSHINNDSLYKADRIVRDASQEIVRLNLPIVLRSDKGCSGCSSTPGPGLTDVALPTELEGRVPDEVWIKHTTKLGPIFRGLRSKGTNAWCGLSFFCFPIIFPFNLIHANHVAKKVDKDLRAWQTSFNADLASHGVFVKTQSCTTWYCSDDGHYQTWQNRRERLLAVAITENEVADLKAEPHLFGGKIRALDNICCSDLCLHYFVMTAPGVIET